MYLSCLLIDVGDNPDRPRPGRECGSATSTTSTSDCAWRFRRRRGRSDDPDFLKPFHPEDFAAEEPKQVHVKRAERGGFPLPHRPASRRRGRNPRPVAVRARLGLRLPQRRIPLGRPPQVKPFDPAFAAGEQLRFRLGGKPDAKDRHNEPVGWAAQRNSDFRCRRTSLPVAR